MKPPHQVSRAAIELVKAFEGYRRFAARLPDGRWTIGYGHTLSAREGAEVNEADAEALLLYDLLAISGAVTDLVYTPLTQNQFDALVSFASNVGLEVFRSSSVLLLVNEGALLRAAYALEAWRKASFDGEEVVVDALVRRRATEKALFVTPDGGFVPAPSAVVIPRLDRDAIFAEVVDVHAPMDGPHAVAIPRANEIGAILAAGGQVELPLEAGEPLAPSPDDPADQSETLQSVLSEVLYELPGYSAESVIRPAKGRLDGFSVVQLVLIGLAGVALLVVAFFLLLRGSASSGVTRMLNSGLAVVAGLGGAVLTFSSIYQLLNRFDHDA
jgi:lysozyme